jgi:hypothetical protein
MLLSGTVSVDANAAPSRQGVVSGTAVPCSSLMKVLTAHLVVFRGNTLVASGRFRTGSTFHFALAPGRYSITNDAAYPAGTPFRIRAGHLTRVVVVDACE